MTTGAGDPTFVDTNVLVYSSVATAPLYHGAQQAIQHLVAAGVELWISRQVLREYLATLSRLQTYSNPLPMPTLVADIQFFEQRFHIAEDGPQVTAQLPNLLSQVPVGGKQIHDTNIVATMQVHGIGRLLTHNAADFARFAGIITVIPV